MSQKISTALILAMFVIACEQVEDQLAGDETSAEGVAAEGDPCDTNRTQCTEGREMVLKCQSGEWIVWDDCAYFGGECAVKNGNARCFGAGEIPEDDEEEKLEEKPEEDSGQCSSEPVEEEPEEETKEKDYDIVLDDPILTDPEEYQDCYQGNYVLNGYSALSQLHQYRCINGDLLVIANVDFMNAQELELVTGSVIIAEGTNPGAFGATELREIGGNLLMVSTGATNLGMDSLEEVGGNVIVRGNAQLRGMHFPSLRYYEIFEAANNGSLTCEQGNFTDDFDISSHTICGNRNCGSHSC